MTTELSKFDPLAPSTWLYSLFQDTHLDVTLSLLPRIPSEYKAAIATEQVIFNYMPEPWKVRIFWSPNSRRVLKPEIVDSDADEGIWLEWTNKICNHWAIEWLKQDLMYPATGQLPQVVPIDLVQRIGTPRWIASLTITNKNTVDSATAIIEWDCPMPDSPDLETFMKNQKSTWSIDTNVVLDMLPIGMALMDMDGVVSKTNTWLKNHEPSILKAVLPQHWETLFHPDWIKESWDNLKIYKRASYITPWLHPYDGHSGLINGPYTLSLTPSDTGAVLQLTPLYDHYKIFKSDDWDKLTGLRTRSGWIKDAQEILKINQHKKYWIGVIGLDRFQSINDTLGHSAGDWILQEIAARLKHVYTGTYARWSGDEFCLLVEGDLPESPFDSLFNDPIHYKNHTFSLTCSAGVVNVPENRIETISQWIQYAEWALRDAKEQGRGKTIVASTTINENRKTQFYIENGLSNAVKLKQFFLLFQPLIRLSDKKIIGAEALLRWQHPEIGIIAPQHFIPVAEETGAIAPMTAWVLESACLDALTWNDDVSDGKFFLSVNLSPSQFYDPNLVDEIYGLISAMGFPAKSLKLEITEGIVLQDTDHNRDTLERLMKLGVGLAIDDFGTGYSSLAYLKNFPVQQLKIDKTFVQGINRQHNRLLTENIIKLAHNMNMQVVAEGVETDEQERMLQEMGCDLAQGYKYGKPMTSTELKALLDDN